MDPIKEYLKLEPAANSLVNVRQVSVVQHLLRCCRMPSSMPLKVKRNRDLGVYRVTTLCPESKTCYLPVHVRCPVPARSLRL